MSKVAVAEENELHNRTSIGFWIYLMTDCMLFGSLFITFIILRGATADGPSGREIFDMPMVLAETMILLLSSFTCGLALLAMKTKNVRNILWALAGTYLLGVAFLTIEISEFVGLIHEGNGPSTSAFLSAFFTLVGTHGAHITIGLIWLLTLAWVLYKKGLTAKIKRQLTLFGLFWHFLDLIWIFIFTVVYLMGVAI